jgi:hypothetical protein
MSEKKFCQNDDGDCPCLYEHDPGYFECRLLPLWKEIGDDPTTNFCYSGRQIMEKEATWKALKSSWPAEAMASAMGGKIEK